MLKFLHIVESGKGREQNDSPIHIVEQGSDPQRVSQANKAQRTPLQ